MITQIMTMGIAIMIEPMRPPISISGRKAAIVVSEEASTGASMRRMWKGTWVLERITNR